MPKVTAQSVDATVTAAASARTGQILRTEQVHRRIAGICFKTGPPQHRRRLGAETEWIVVDPVDPAQPVDPNTLRHLQTLIGPPPGGSRLTIEPGGQVELSSQPAPDAAACLAALGRDVTHLTTALADVGLALAPTATDAWSLRPRLLDSPRYRAMEAYFQTLGEHRAGCGRAMMRATASLQVNLETGADAADVAHRWRLLHDVGPTLVAAFANSPRLAGERTGWVSTRQAIWRDLDPPRTHAPADLLDPAAGYASLALDAPLMFVRDGDDCVPAPGGSLRDWIEGRLPALRPPEPADLDAHLTTLFPPVRARGFFEVRYLDTQPLRWWPVPVVVLAALADHRDLGDRALDACRDVRDAWDRAARDGVRDPALDAAARTLLADVARTLASRGQGEQADLVRAFVDRYTDRGRCPADDTADRFAESTIAAPPPAGPERHVRSSPAFRRAGRRVAIVETAKRSRAPGPGLADNPDDPDNPDQPDQPDQPDHPDNPDQPDHRGGDMTIDVTGAPDVVREQLARELARVRERSRGLTTAILDDGELLAQHSKLMSPLVWDLAHVGNYEELWLLREAAGIEPMRPEIDDIYDAFEHPRSTRPTLPLLSPAESTGYLDLVRRKVLDSLQTARFEGAGPLHEGGFVYGLVLQHEHQHGETMLATHQLRRGQPVLGLDAEPPVPRDEVPLPAEVRVPGGSFVMGTDDDPWAYDNERPAYEVHVPEFWIDTTPVSVGAYRAFVESGGYDDERWWSRRGWEWRCRSGKRAPAFWFADGDGWSRRRFARTEPLPDDEPVQHVCWFEADAYARWAGRRLPTEAEWEKAASWDEATGTKRRFPWGDALPTDQEANVGERRYRPTPVGSYPGGAAPCGARQLIGDVWEWTSSDFHGHPGFCTFPYAEYSEVFFGGDYKVLRGGSWATDSLATRATFRNWDHPIRRQIFAGFRTARDARPARAGRRARAGEPTG